VSKSGPEPADRAAEIAAAWARERPNLPVASIGILTRIWQVAKLASDDRRRTLAALGMDAATLDLLSTLRRAGPPYRLATRELTTRGLVTAGAITQRVDRAQRAGLVLRLPPERGSRLVLIELTAAGHTAVESAVLTVLSHEQRIVDVLDPVQQEQLAGMLAALLGGFERSEGTTRQAG
jgi:DNA-binding MarR family transcriptional regulator